MNAANRQRRQSGEFGEYLRHERRARHRSVGDIAHVTRIPERSLRCLEAGELDRLPADVFVRGFIRAYAQTLGLDPDDAVRRYSACTREECEPAPVAIPPGPAAAEQTDRVVGMSPALRVARSFLPPMLRGDKESRRGPITLAVIILVIVATLAMSYLLRRPSASGDGITRAPSVSSDERA